MYNGRLFAVSMQVFLQKAPRSDEQTAAEATTEARAPRAWGRLRARCPPLPHLGDTPLRSVVPASVGAKSMDGYAGREGQTELGRKTAAAAPPTAGRRLVYACSSDVPL